MYHVRQLPGTVDARYPKDCANGAAPLGIDTLTVTGPAGSGSAACWSICEGSDGGLLPNSITSISEGAPGDYTIMLARPITPGSCTTITYDGAGTAQTTKFSFLPGDVSGNGTASPGDIMELIDILNGMSMPVWDVYSTDVDASGVTGAPDILAIIDVLNGADCFAPWNAITVETGDTCGNCPIATP